MAPSTNSNSCLSALTFKKLSKILIFLVFLLLTFSIIESMIAMVISWDGLLLTIDINPIRLSIEFLFSLLLFNPLFLLFVAKNVGQILIVILIRLVSGVPITFLLIAEFVPILPVFQKPLNAKSVTVFSIAPKL